MKGKTKGWSERRRKRQACNARRQKLWRHATGPRTAAGKAVSAQNARKHGLGSAEVRELRRLLRIQRHFVYDFMAALLARQGAGKGSSLGQ
jgi:hypothetical protein